MTRRADAESVLRRMAARITDADRMAAASRLLERVAEADDGDALRAVLLELGALAALDGNRGRA